MPTPEGLLSLEEALGQAAVEAGVTDEVDDLFGAEQPAGKAPQPESQEQTRQDETQPGDKTDALFTDLLEAEPEKEAKGVDWDSAVEVPGVGQVPLSEMRDGYLRQADYTRKTQALAAERKAFEEENAEAIKLFRHLVDDPAGTAAFLAVQTGVVDEGAVAGKVRNLQAAWKPPPSREEIEAEVEKRVQAAVAQHPVVLEAQQQALIASIERDFSRIEQKHGIRLTDRDKEAILKRAIDSGTPDLELVTESMLRRLDKVRQDRESAREAATPRPGVRPPSSDSPAEVKSIEDAFALALAEATGGGG